ncbi:hypothetical protein ACFQX7_30845 [Luedemannella flava]
MNTWFGGSDTGRRDLAAIAADPRFLPALISGLRDYLGAKREAESGERRANALRKRATWTLEHAGLRTAARTWLATVGERVGSTPTVLTLADALDELAPLWTYDGLSLTPDMFAGLAAADPAEALARVLRGGLPSELSWPEHEATSTDVGQANEQDSWPFLVFSATARAVVLGPDGVVLDHAYRTPRDVKLHSYDKLRAGAFVDGELRVDWSSGCYWSGRPTETLGGHHGWGYGSWSGGGLPLPEGGGPPANGRCASATRPSRTSSRSSATARRTGATSPPPRTTTRPTGASTTRRRHARPAQPAGVLRGRPGPGDRLGRTGATCGPRRRRTPARRWGGGTAWSAGGSSSTPTARSPAPGSTAGRPAGP